jgi:hypothetical protein
MTANFYPFGEFELDRSRFELRHKGRALTRERIPIELRILLIEKDASRLPRGDRQPPLPNTASTPRNRTITRAIRRRNGLTDPTYLPVPGRGFIRKIEMECERVPPR